jgi:hypothetical protein
MSYSQGDPWTPSRELLAAFADGELDAPHVAPLSRQIEAWLAAHPDAAAELEAQLELARLMASTAPLEPAPATWDKVWSRIQQTPPRRAGRWVAALWLAGLAVTSAAAIGAILWLNGPFQTPAPEGPPQQAERVILLPPLGEREPQSARDTVRVRDLARPQVALLPVNRVSAGERRPEVVDVLEVATADEVEIVYARGGDTTTLVVGRLPLVGPLILLAPHEVEVKPPVNDSAGTAMRWGGGSTPMVWTPLPGETAENKEER